MSTRRARIKAVTSLPPRRKNADNADNKSKQVPNKECPRTPGSLAKIDGNSVKSPVSKIESSVIKSVDKTPEIIKPTTVIDKSNISKNLERLPVITAASSFRPVFVSPQAKVSPRRKLVPSPVRTPKAADNVAKTILEKDIPAVIKPTTLSKEKIQATDLIRETSNLNVSENKNDVPDDYNIPSLPESVTEDVMDGIIPLQPACSAPKPIDLLKNEIISEKAEVLFDPIVPLPSPSKVRLKLRPVPRLAPLRRNSVQGSASESEDESRRALLNSGSTASNVHRQRHDSQTSQSTIHSIPNREGNRIRNDSVCSNISQATAAPPISTSPVKEKHYPKSRRQEMSRRMAAMRRRRETIKRDNLTMYDLIFYNPESNPIIPDQEELDAKEANEKEAANKDAEGDGDNANDAPTADAVPVPQIKLGPNGEIVLDEQSLVINQSASNRTVSTVVREGAWGNKTGNSYRRTARTAEWSDAETVRFYRALAAIGTDFTLMEPLFPGRTRRDLKLKFKKEEKCNGAQVDKALRSSVEWDATRLQSEFKEERETAARRARQSRDRLQTEKREQQERKIAAKELGLKQSRCTKALGSSVMPDNINGHNEIEINSADNIIRRANEDRRMRRKRKEPDPVVTPVAIAPQPVQIAPQQLLRTPQQSASSPFATLTLIQNNTVPQSRRNSATDSASISKLDPKVTKPTNMPETVHPISAVPGSLVVLTVNDPNSPSKKMLQTYIAHAEGVLTPVALPPTLLSSVVGYMKRGTPKSNVSARSSPLLTSPGSVTSHDSRMCVTPSVIQVNPSPTKRQRHSSYTITPL